MMVSCQDTLCDFSLWMVVMLRSNFQDWEEQSYDCYAVEASSYFLAFVSLPVLPFTFFF